MVCHAVLAKTGHPLFNLLFVNGALGALIKTAEANLGLLFITANALFTLVQRHRGFKAVHAATNNLPASSPEF